MSNKSEEHKRKIERMDWVHLCNVKGHLLIRFPASDHRQTLDCHKHHNDHWPAPVTLIEFMSNERRISAIKSRWLSPLWKVQMGKWNPSWKYTVME